MKRLRYFFAPIAIFAAVFMVMMLPQKISQLRDERYYSQVHTESYTDQNNLPSESLDMIEKIELLLLYRSGNKIDFVSQELLGPADDEHIMELLADSLQMLIDNGVLPDGIIPEIFPYISGERVYLQYSGKSAEYIKIVYVDKKSEINISLIIEEETNSIMELFISHPLMMNNFEYSSTITIGKAYLELLGIVDYEVSTVDDMARFSISGHDMVYRVFRSPQYIEIYPEQSYSYDSISIASSN